jgi:hypothetical protein
LKNPYCRRLEPAFNGNETLKKSIEKFSVASFSFSSSTASRLLLFVHCGNLRTEACAATGLDGAGNEASAFASMHQAERRREAQSRHYLQYCFRHIGVRRAKRLRTK